MTDAPDTARVPLGPDGAAIVWCEGAFATTYGKTAHGLVRRTRRYRLAAVIDSTLAGRDAGEVLDGQTAGIPIVADLAAALATSRRAGSPATHFVIGLAPDGGRLPPAGRRVVAAAIAAGLHVDSGLHDFLSEDPDLAGRAAAAGVRIRDVRRTPPRGELHGWTGKIEEVGSLRLAVLGTDSAVGKRTTAWILVDALAAAGVSTELVGTGQTAWMQGARYGLLLDSLVSDFMAGEIEHATWLAWSERRPDVIVIEGQGSLMNPAYPGGYEILAAARPHGIVLQHAPARAEYDGFPGCPVHPLETQIEALRLVSGRPVVAITLNHEGMDRAEIDRAAADIQARIGVPVLDPLWHGPERLVSTVRGLLGDREVAP
ncbi:MAG: DUF1611 domain-containing protein [Gemmatimonadota bacterium]|nr:DUF1611 domain-containing protein [Gemmatimonadota bacterium]